MSRSIQSTLFLLVRNSWLLSPIFEQLPPIRRVKTPIPAGFVLLEYTVVFVSNNQSK